MGAMAFLGGLGEGFQKEGRCTWLGGVEGWKGILGSKHGGLNGPDGGAGPKAGEVGGDQPRGDCECPVGDFQFAQKLTFHCYLFI